jgi:hypothetical protein
MDSTQTPSPEENKMTTRNPFETLRENPFEDEDSTPRCEHGTPLRARCPICTEERWAADHGREPWSR